jgi:hypothetical protein
MLPNLGQLSLHDEAETGGFYEPNPADQAAMNDDPVTLEKPLYTMSFRVRLPQNNADGSPRYKSFAPLELWTWIKNNNSLPAREGPVWYEDWWALCNTFNPTHQNIPAWAHRLERYDQYEARMAREAAERAQQEARERARAEREAEAAAAERQREQEVAARAAERAREVAEGVRAAGARNAAADAPGDDDLGGGAPNNRRALPRLRPGEVRRGAQRATDKLISWRFWLKGTRDEARISQALGFMRTRFGAFMRANFSREAVDNWTSRLVLSVGARALGPPAEEGAGASDPAFPVLYVDCHVFVPPPYAGSFQDIVTTEMSEIEYGVGSAMRRMFGVIGAWSRGPADPTDGVRNRGSWRDLPAVQDEDLVEPSMTRGEYAAWRDWATDDEPVRIVPGRVGPQADTDWAVEWRFWLKGELPMEYQFMQSRMREWFRLYFSRMALTSTFNNSSFDYGERLHLYLAKRRLNLSGGTTEPAHAIQVDVQVYVPSRVFADEFVRRIDYLCTSADGQGRVYFEYAMRTLFGIESAMEWAHAEKPVVRDKPDGRLAHSKRMGPYSTERAVAPVLGREQYDAWATFSHVPPNADQLSVMDREVRAGGEIRVRWRFWLKGEMTQEEKLANAIWMRRAFARYMVQNPIPRRFYYGAGQFDDDMRWFRRTRATIIQEPHTITNEQGSSFTVYPLRCEFEIYFDRLRASAFVLWASAAVTVGSWEDLAEDWVGFVQIRAWDGWDKPQQLDNEDPHDDTHDLMTEIPTDTVHAWNQWVGWRRVRRTAA